MTQSKSRRVLRIAAASTILGTLLAIPQLESAAHSALASSTWKVGVSNATIGNGWRDEMVCSIKAQLHASGRAVSDVQQSNADTATQISQINTMVSKGDNAIIVDPNSPTALNGPINTAANRHIPVVVVDQTLNISGPNIYQVANNQRAYGRLGMQWLVNQIHHRGNIVLLEGIQGAPADTARQLGQRDVLKHNPNVHVLAREYTNWDFTTGAQQMTRLLNSGKRIDGVWTSGIDYVVVNAFLNAHRALVPIVGADNNGFVHQLITMRGRLVGAVVTNPPPVGGAGAAVALKVLSGQHPPHMQLLRPQVWSNTNAAGLRQLRAHRLPSKGPSYGAAWNVPGFTTYSKHALLNCNPSW